MNESILELWKDTSVINVDEKTYKQLLKFVKYLDKHSMWLAQYNNEDNSFLFSNDGQRISFTMSEMKQHIEK